MKISSEKKYDVLDNRAATYEKLVDWKAALRDAKAMIKEDKTVAKVRPCGSAENSQI